MLFIRKCEICPRPKSPLLRTDRRSLSNWVHRFNAVGPVGVHDCKVPEAVPKLMAMQKAELVAVAAAGVNPLTDGGSCQSVCGNGHTQVMVNNLWYQR